MIYYIIFSKIKFTNYWVIYVIKIIIYKNMKCEVLKKNLQIYNMQNIMVTSYYHYYGKHRQKKNQTKDDL